jgi:hypothetical protein
MSFFGGCSHVGKPWLSTLCLSFSKLSIPVGFGGFRFPHKACSYPYAYEPKRDATSLQVLQKLSDFASAWHAWFKNPAVSKAQWIDIVMAFTIGWIQYTILAKTGVLRRDAPGGIYLSLHAKPEHISLQYMFDDYSECHAKRLENISTCFPYVRSLLLRYEIPKVSRETLSL